MKSLSEALELLQKERVDLYSFTSNRMQVDWAPTGFNRAENPFTRPFFIKLDFFRTKLGDNGDRVASRGGRITREGAGGAHGKGAEHPKPETRNSKA